MSCIPYMLKAIVELWWVGMSINRRATPLGTRTEWGSAPITYAMTIMTLRDGTRAKTGSPRARLPRVYKGNPVMKFESLNRYFTY